MPIVQFAPFSSLIQPSLWHKLTDLKIDVLQLSDAAVPVSGSYSIGRTVKDRETGQEIALSCNLTVGAESFDESYKWVPKTNDMPMFFLFEAIEGHLALYQSWAH